MAYVAELVSKLCMSKICVLIDAAAISIAELIEQIPYTHISADTRILFVTHGTKCNSPASEHWLILNSYLPTHRVIRSIQALVPRVPLQIYLFCCFSGRVKHNLEKVMSDGSLLVAYAGHDQIDYRNIMRYLLVSHIKNSAISPFQLFLNDIVQESAIGASMNAVIQNDG